MNPRTRRLRRLRRKWGRPARRYWRMLNGSTVTFVGPPGLMDQYRTVYAGYSDRVAGIFWGVDFDDLESYEY